MSQPLTVVRLAAAIEAVRHRGIQKRVDRRQPEVPKRVTSKGADWDPCEICRKEAGLVLAELER